MPQGAAFLVARGRHTGFKTLLAPGFLVDAGLHHVLAESTGTSTTGGDDARVVEVDDAAVGAFSVGYTSDVVQRADLEGSDAHGGGPLEDEHGRALEIVYGVVCRDELSQPLDAADLQTARAQALQRYRSFLADETDKRVQASTPFALRSGTRARAGGASRPAGGNPQASHGAGGMSLRRRLSGPRGIVALAIVLALVAIGALIVVRDPAAPTVTVYSSLPLHGTNSARSAQVVRGIELALQRAGGEAGGFRVTYESLDDSRGRAGWSRQKVAANARKAAEDDHVAVYIGDLDSAASAVSIPILSRSRVAQISATNTAVGLTTDEPGAGRGEPGKYYAGGVRNYARIVPRDTIQARALVTLARTDGCSRVAIVRSHDAGLGDGLVRAMTAQHMRPVLDEVVAARTQGYASALARRAARRRAGCVIFTGDTKSAAVRIFTSLARTLGSKVRLYGSDRLATRAFTDGVRGGLPERVARRVKLTLGAPGPGALAVTGLSLTAAPRGRRPVRRSADPYAIFGYEAMSLALDAIKRSRTARRNDIVKALLDTKHRRSVLGTYSIDANGDTTLTSYGVFAVRHGALAFERRVGRSG